MNSESSSTILSADPAATPLLHTLRATAVDPRAAELLADLIEHLRQQEADRSALYEKYLEASKMAQLGLLTASLAHELKQPLLGIKAFAQLLEEQPEAADEVREHATMIGQQAERMEELIADYTGFARSPSAESAVDLNHAVEAVHRMFVPQVRHTTVDLHLHLAEDHLAVALGRGRLQQILLNLIANARDAVTAVGGGTITVLTRPTPEGRAQVVVADTGCGVPERMDESIFEPFITTKGEDGTGLGLHICRQIAQEAEGHLELIAPGTVGLPPTYQTAFSLLLPRREQDRGAVAEADPAPPGQELLGSGIEDELESLFDDLVTKEDPEELPPWEPVTEEPADPALEDLLFGDELLEDPTTEMPDFPEETVDDPFGELEPLPAIPPIEEPEPLPVSPDTSAASLLPESEDPAGFEPFDWQIELATDAEESADPLAFLEELEIADTGSLEFALGDEEEVEQAMALLREELAALDRAPDESSVVLVVDDEEVIRRVFRSLLSQLGVEVKVAASGEEALAILEAGTVNVLIADKNLPDITGVDLIGRATAIRPALESLVITAFPSLETVTTAIDRGAGGYLTKPFRNLESVRRRVKAVIHHQSLRARAVRLVERLRSANQLLARHLSPEELEERMASFREAMGTFENQPGEGQILVLDNDPLADHLEENGYQVVRADERLGFSQYVGMADLHLIIASTEQEDLPLHELLATAQAENPTAAVMVLAADPNLPQAIEALEAGAMDYVPLSTDGFEIIDRKVERAMRLQSEDRKYRTLVQDLTRVNNQMMQW